MRSSSARIRSKGDKGSAAFEYIGLLTAVGVVIALVAASFADAAPQVEARTAELVCAVLTGPDEGCGDEADPGVPEAAPGGPEALTERPVELRAEPTAKGRSDALTSSRLLSTDLFVGTADAPRDVFAGLGTPATAPDGDVEIDWCGPVTTTSSSGTLTSGDYDVEGEKQVCSDSYGTIRECGRGRTRHYWLGIPLIWSSWSATRCTDGQSTPAADLTCEQDGYYATVTCILPAADNAILRCTPVDGADPAAFGCQDLNHDLADQRGMPYPGDSGTCTPVQDLSNFDGGQRACLSDNGTLYHCVAQRGIDDTGRDAPADAAWGCDSRSVPPLLLGGDACRTVAPSSAECAIGGTTVRCLQPESGRDAGILLHCQGNPEQAVTDLAQDGADPDSVITDEDCDAAIGLTPDAIAAVDAASGPPLTGPELTASVDAQRDELAGTVQAITGYDIRDEAQRQQLQQAYADLRTLLDNQVVDVSWAEAESVVDSFYTDQVPEEELANPGRQPLVDRDKICRIVAKNVVLGVVGGVTINGYVLATGQGTSAQVIALSAIAFGFAASTLFEMQDAVGAARNEADQRNQWRTMRALSSIVGFLQQQMTQASEAAAAAMQQATAAQQAADTAQAAAAAAGGDVAAQAAAAPGAAEAAAAQAEAVRINLMEMGLAVDQLQTNAAAGSIYDQARDWITWLFRAHQE